MCPDRSNPGRQMLWGLVLMGFGVLFLLDRTGRFDIHEIWHYWPVIFFIIGLGHLMFPNRGVDRVDGVIWFGIGFWFMANQNHWWGLNWANSWPLILLAIGVQTVLRALVEGRNPRRKRKNGDDVHPHTGSNAEVES